MRGRGTYWNGYLLQVAHSHSCRVSRVMAAGRQARWWACLEPAAADTRCDTCTSCAQADLLASALHDDPGQWAADQLGWPAALSTVATWTAAMQGQRPHGVRAHVRRVTHMAGHRVRAALHEVPIHL